MSILVTPDEMRAAEAAAVNAGRPEPDLMRLAATRIANWVETHIPQRVSTPRFAAALVGPGNNGGDALVALALLSASGWRVGALLLGRDGFGSLPADSESLDAIEIVTLDALDEADVILDGVYGIGSRPSLPAGIATVFRRALDIRIERGTPLLSIDVPSGVDAGSGAASPDAFVADVTLCLGLPKIGLTREPAATHTGELIVLDIGIVMPIDNRHPQLVDERYVRHLLPRRRASSHKHQTGTLLVIGGASTYYGAPRLAAEAASRSGAGLVCVATPASIVPVIASQVPELVFLPLDDSASRAAQQIVEWVASRNGHVDAFVIGPGLGQSAHTSELLIRLFANQDSGLFSPRTLGSTETSVVLDADALNWIARRGELPLTIRDRSAVLTPHAGELSRLMNEPREVIVADTIGHATRASERFKQTVVLKSGYSVAASPDGPVLLAPRAAPELATAGTGDVLAGLVGGLLAQGLSTADAAGVALYIGSMAGRSEMQRQGVRGVMASDVINAIPAVMARLTESNLLRY